MRNFNIIYFIFLVTKLFSQEVDSLEVYPPDKLFLTLDSNEKIKIDTIIITGNRITKDYIILNEFTFSNNDTISNEIIEYNKNRVYSLGLFNKIEDFLYIYQNKNVLEFKVDERWFFFPYPIFGIKDRNWKNLYYGLGLAHINFLGKNQKIFGSFGIGYDPWVGIRYFNPNVNSSKYLLDITLNHSKTKNKSIYIDNKDFYEYWYNAQLSLGKRFDIYNTSWINFGYNHISVTEQNVNKTISKSGKDFYFSINISTELNTRDLSEYPMKGEYIVGAIKKNGFGESEVDFLQFWLDVRKYIPIENNSICFRGFTGLSFGSSIPNYSHYFIGYSERIRGNFYKALEGENIAGFSSEIRIPLFGPEYYVIDDIPIPQFAIFRYGLTFTLFFDAAEVWDKYNFLLNKIEYGFGCGFNFLLPYSLVLRLELGLNKTFKSEIIFDVGVSF